MLRDQSQFINSNHGVMLLELLIAVFISLLMISVLTRIYFSMHQNEMRLHQLEVQQDHAQRAVTMMRDDIFMAGYIGCGKLSNEFKVISYQQFSLTPQNYLVVEKNKLTLRYQSFPGAVVMNNMKSAGRIVTDKSELFHVGEILLISDCVHAEILKVAHVWISGNVQVIIPESPLHFLYDQFAEIGKLIIHQYYLGKDIHQQQHQTGVGALFRADIKNRHHEMVEGVKDLSFSQINNDVFFEFSTTGNDKSRLWHGYAGCRCCE